MNAKQDTDTAQVARTILSQLGGINRLMAMIGAHHFIDNPRSVTFRWKAKARNGANVVTISLEPSDTYSVRFFQYRAMKLTELTTHSDVYADSLVRLFELETGLYLSL